MAPQAVVLDLDGTVWHSRPWYARVAGHGDPARVSQALAELASGRPAATILKGAGYTKTQFRAVCESADPPLACVPGILQALQHLHDCGVKLGAATNLPGWMATPMADASGVTPLLSALVDYTATRRHKPYPDPVLEALRQLNTAPGPFAWYVGDERQDATAANAGGLLFAWASWDTTSEVPDGTSLILGEPADLVTLIGLTLEEAL